MGKKNERLLARREYPIIINRAIIKSMNINTKEALEVLFGATGMFLIVLSVSAVWKNEIGLAVLSFLLGAVFFFVCVKDKEEKQGY